MYIIPLHSSNEVNQGYRGVGWFYLQNNTYRVRLWISNTANTNKDVQEIL